MTTEKIYGPWIKWHGGECPVPPDTMVEVKFRYGLLERDVRAGRYHWNHYDEGGDIVEYRTVTRPLTFEDVEPLTEIPPEGTEYWYLEATNAEGVSSFVWRDDGLDAIVLKRRVAYLDKEHALVAARHIFGLKGGEL